MDYARPVRAIYVLYLVRRFCEVIKTCVRVLVIKWNESIFSIKKPKIPVKLHLKNKQKRKRIRANFYLLPGKTNSVNPHSARWRRRRADEKYCEIAVRTLRSIVKTRRDVWEGLCPIDFGPSLFTYGFSLRSFWARFLFCAAHDPSPQGPRQRARRIEPQGRSSQTPGMSSMSYAHG